VAGNITHFQQTRHRGGTKAKRRLEQEQCLELRNRGMTVFMIAQETGLSERTVDRRIREALDARVDPKTDEYRQRLSDHLDDLVRRHEQSIVGLEVIIMSPESSPDAVIEAVKERRAALDSLLRIADRRARLYGMDAPIKVEQTVTEVEPEDLELAKMIEEAKRKHERWRCSPAPGHQRNRPRPIGEGCSAWAGFPRWGQA